MTNRVLVYIDYQNMFSTARNEFADRLRGTGGGAFWPHLLGEELIERTPYEDRVLAGVRVYRGMPDPRHDPVGHAAAEQQTAEWEFHDGVTVIHRRLQYPSGGGAPVEKGIDMALGVDLYVGAVKGWYDTAVVCSRDTDLIPAMESVRRDFGHRVRIELAAWGGAGGAPMDLGEPQVWCHWLELDVMWRIADTNRYSTTTVARTRPHHPTPPRPSIASGG